MLFIYSCVFRATTYIKLQVIYSSLFRQMTASNSKDYTDYKNRNNNKASVVCDKEFAVQLINSIS